MNKQKVYINRYESSNKNKAILQYNDFTFVRHGNVLTYNYKDCGKLYIDWLLSASDYEVYRSRTSEKVIKNSMQNMTNDFVHLRYTPKETGHSRERELQDLLTQKTDSMKDVYLKEVNKSNVDYGIILYSGYDLHKPISSSSPSINLASLVINLPLDSDLLLNSIFGIFPKLGLPIEYASVTDDIEDRRFRVTVNIDNNDSKIIIKRIDKNLYRVIHNSKCITYIGDDLRLLFARTSYFDRIRVWAEKIYYPSIGRVIIIFKGVSLSDAFLLCKSKLLSGFKRHLIDAVELLSIISNTTGTEDHSPNPEIVSNKVIIMKIPVINREYNYDVTDNYIFYNETENVIRMKAGNREAVISSDWFTVNETRNSHHGMSQLHYDTTVVTIELKVSILAAMFNKRKPWTSEEAILYLREHYCQ